MDAVTGDTHLIRDEATLEALYGTASAGAIAKEVDYLHPHYRAMIAASPFMVLATAGPEGLDTSPRGDPAGFVHVVDDKTLLIPDRRGNNRMDSLRNIVRDPRVALLFLVPGIGRTLRVNGTASITTDPALCASFAIEGKTPRSVVVVTAKRVYTQCAKALVRSRLWDPASHVPESALPSSGEMLRALSAGFDAEGYDRDYPRRLRETIY